MLFKNPLKWSALLGSALLALTPVMASDAGALLEALVRKGILSDQEAENIRADLVRDAAVPPAVGTAGSNFATRLRVGGRLQVQYAGLNTDIENAGDPAATSHFFLRRAYVTLRTDFGPDWNGIVSYDFAAGTFDNAWIQWRKDTWTVDVGLRKVNLGYEERISSSALKALERSGMTRFFVEENNGRRLGAGSRRIGVFADGRSGKFFYGAAITNPERAVTFTNSAAPGNNTNNNFAYWANGGYNGTFEGGTFVVGGGIGLLPDQGGKSGTAPFGVGTGNDLSIFSVYADINRGPFGLVAEYMAADVERGASATEDAKPWGFFVQPSYALNDKIELVARYSYVDSDGRGVNLSDGVRSAPGGGTHDKLTEVFLGGNWYIKQNDLKLQAGYVYGKSEDTVTGGDASAETNGFRSQLQLNF